MTNSDHDHNHEHDHHDSTNDHHDHEHEHHDHEHEHHDHEHEHHDHGHEHHAPTETVESHAGHTHTGDFWADFMALMTDPAHLAFEFVFSIVFDLIIVSLIGGVVIKKFIVPRLRKSIHEEIDREHGIEHDNEVAPKE